MHKHRRGRPPVPPEQKREKAKLRQQRSRRKAAEQQFAEATNGGRRVELCVLHWLDLLDFLVTVDLLDGHDVENVFKIEAAVGSLLNFHLDELRAFRESIDGSYCIQLPAEQPGPNFRPSSSGPGTVWFWTDRDDAKILELDDEIQIKERLEDILFRIYSNIEDHRRPDALGIPWGSFSYGRHKYAFENVTREEAKAAQDRFEEAEKPTYEEAGLKE